LCAACTDEDDLVEQIYVTLVHEFAHHFGIDDDRLDDLGWG
jgi:predicted Zn-dependent protease with MMP-like domain